MLIELSKQEKEWLKEVLRGERDLKQERADIEYFIENRLEENRAPSIVDRVVDHLKYWLPDEMFLREYSSRSQSEWYHTLGTLDKLDRIRE